MSESAKARARFVTNAVDAVTDSPVGFLSLIACAVYEQFLAMLGAGFVSAGAFGLTVASLAFGLFAPQAQGPRARKTLAHACVAFFFVWIGTWFGYTEHLRTQSAALQARVDCVHRLNALSDRAPQLAKQFASDPDSLPGKRPEVFAWRESVVVAVKECLGPELFHTFQTNAIRDEDFAKRNTNFQINVTAEGLNYVIGNSPLQRPEPKD